MRQVGLKGALAAAALAVAVVAYARPSPPLPRPAPQGRGPVDAVALNRSCEGCHAEIAAEWRGSLHQRSWDDAVFQAALALEPIAFCRGCHAPEADPALETASPRHHLGVSCVTCHVQNGHVLGARRLADRTAPHELLVDARLAGVDACAGCHQFEFPKPQQAPMQGTLSEHRASPFAGKSCQACHMPSVSSKDGTSHKSHRFRVAGDSALLRAAVSATAWRAGDRAINVSLSATNVGHAVPTGDMFRRLEVRAHAGGAVAKPVVLERRFLVTRGPDGVERRQTGDDRLPASGEAKTVWLPFGESIGQRTIEWQVVYQRMDPVLAASFGLDPGADEIVIAQGELPTDEVKP